MNVTISIKRPPGKPELLQILASIADIFNELKKICPDVVVNVEAEI